MSAGKSFVEVETKKLLKTWLTEHIQRSDKKYVPYLQPVSGNKPMQSRFKHSAGQRAIAPTKPAAAGMRAATHPIPVEKKSVAAVSASDEWEEF